MSVRIVETALADLEALHDYILDQSGAARAWAYVSRIRAHCEKLQDFPYRSRAADDISPGLRTLIFERRVTIFYRLDDMGVRIVRIIYAGRDYSEDEFPD